MNSTPSGAAHSDALVLFGVTGDLAHKMIFPALYAMAKRGVLDVPVVGVAFSNWDLAQLRKRAEDSIRKAGKIDDRPALVHLLSLLRYVDGDYKDPDTFKALKKALGTARHPAHYRSPATWGPASTPATATSRAWPSAPTSRPSAHCGCSSTRGAGKACRGTCARASIWPPGQPRA